MSSYICVFCLADDNPHLHEVTEEVKETPRCTINDDHGYLVGPGKRCCNAQDVKRDDLGNHDGSGDAGGPSWVCTNCGNRTTW